VSSQLDIDITRDDPLCGVAQRFGFELPWTAVRDGHEWLVEVPRGHSLGPGGKGAFDVVADDWQGFVRAVRREIDLQQRQGRTG